MPSFREHRELLALWERFPALERLEPGAGRLALTFDDGPEQDATPAVLDALDAAGARATFFLLGEQLMRDTGLGREVAARGHEIALHGFAHDHHEDLSPQQDRKSTRLNSSHMSISYAVFCLKKKKKNNKSDKSRITLNFSTFIFIPSP